MDQVAAAGQVAYRTLVRDPALVPFFLSRRRRSTSWAD